MSNGAYKERLPLGMGDLKVTEFDWSIEFYFPGPDLRHNGTFVTISSREVDAYISAYQNNWRQYLHLTQATPPGAELTQRGEQGMTIRIGGFHQGVCLTSYHLPVASERELEGVLQSLDWAKQRAPRVQQALRQL